MFRLLTFVTIAAVVCLLPLEVRSQFLTYEFSGTITQVDTNQNGAIPGLQSGDKFTGFVSFNSEGWNSTVGTVFITVNGVDLLFDGPFIYGSVEVIPAQMYRIRVAADAFGDIGMSTFSAVNFGPDLMDTDGSAGHSLQFPESLDLDEFETNVFRILGNYVPTGDQISATGELQEFFRHVLLGDLNLDGVVTLADVAPFVQLLASGGYQLEGDLDQNGDVNLLDVDDLIKYLGG